MKCQNIESNWWFYNCKYCLNSGFDDIVCCWNSYYMKPHFTLTRVSVRQSVVFIRSITSKSRIRENIATWFDMNIYTRMQFSLTKIKTSIFFGKHQKQKHFKGERLNRVSGNIHHHAYDSAFDAKEKRAFEFHRFKFASYAWTRKLAKMQPTKSSWINHVRWKYSNEDMWKMSNVLRTTSIFSIAFLVTEAVFFSDNMLM